MIEKGEHHVERVLINHQILPQLPDQSNARLVNLIEVEAMLGGLRPDPTLLYPAGQLDPIDATR